jgi:hypothetical protein
MRKFIIFCGLALAGCSGPELPMSNGIQNQSPLLRPPWEALVQAGPGAEKDVDYETLNGTPQAPAEIAQVPNAEPVVEDEKVVAKPTGPEIKAVSVLPVKGQGGVELTAAMRKVLKEAGWPVLNSPRPDALTIQGQVSVDAASNGQQLVHLAWVVSTPKGAKLGDVNQANPVPAGTLDRGWGENAGFAAQAAASGIFKLIEKYR